MLFDYRAVLQDQVAILMLEIIAEQSSQHHHYLTRIYDLSRSSLENKDIYYEELFKELETNETQTFIENLMQIEAKIVDMQFRARTCAGITCLESLYSNQNPHKMIKSGDTFYEVIGRYDSL
jgi:hypothetical protein